MTTTWPYGGDPYAKGYFAEVEDELAAQDVYLEQDPDIEWAAGVGILSNPWVRQDGMVIDEDRVVGRLRQPAPPQHVTGLQCPTGWDLVASDHEIACAYHQKAACLGGFTTDRGTFQCTDWDIPSCPPGMETRPGSPKNWCFPTAIPTHTVGRTSPYPTAAERLAIGKYTPDFDSAFHPGAPPDTRVATPDAARSAAPASLLVHAENLIMGREGPLYLRVGLITAGVATVAITLAFALRSSASKGRT